MNEPSSQDSVQDTTCSSPTTSCRSNSEVSKTTASPDSKTSSVTAFDFLPLNDKEKALDMAGGDSENLTVVDVYEQASNIGKEFEGIIDNYGPESVAELMPRVISVLEHLEFLATRNQMEKSEIADLKLNIERLQADKIAKKQERFKYEQELEQIEESWRMETKDLLHSIERVQEENKKLKEALQDQGSDSKNVFEAAPQDELKVIIKLKEINNKQREELRGVHKDLVQKNIDIEAMQSQLERLSRLNSDYRRKTSLTQRQATNLIQEKTDLEAMLHDKEQQISSIRNRVSMVTSLHSETTSPTSPDSLEGKLLVDLSDPNRPRFTLNELRDVLEERNELKTKFIEVSEELQQLKPPSPTDPEAPVQGPINREPDEKLYPEKYAESGIRRFFKLLRISPKRRSSKAAVNACLSPDT